jgi:hypothetical protein
MIDKLFTRKEVDLAELQKFRSHVGFRYGLVFGVILVAISWGIDAWESANFSLELYWAKLAFAALTLLPLCAVVGWLSARFKRASIQILIWSIGGALTGLIAIHLPFEGSSAVAALVDPAVGRTTIFPFVQAAQERTNVMMGFGAAGGLFAALVQKFAGGVAWEHSSSENRMTLGAWAALLLCAPVAIALGSLYDGGANASLRGPARLTQGLILFALDMPPNLDSSQLSSFQALDYGLTVQWRDKFTSHYVQRIAGYDSKSLDDVYVDAAFDSGFIWRCEITRDGSNVRRCMDLAETYRDWITQFLRTSQIRCEDCSLRIEPEAIAWQIQNAQALANPKQISVSHQSGGIATLRATVDNGIVECRIFGAVPVNLQECKFAK